MPFVLTWIESCLPANDRRGNERVKGPIPHKTGKGQKVWTASRFTVNHAGHDYAISTIAGPFLLPVRAAWDREDHMVVVRSAAGVVVRLAPQADLSGSDAAARVLPTAQHGTPLKSLMAEGIIEAGFGIYTGTEELRDGPLRVMPLKRFFEVLASGQVFSAERL